MHPISVVNLFLGVLLGTSPIVLDYGNLKPVPMCVGTAMATVAIFGTPRDKKKE